MATKIVISLVGKQGTGKSTIGKKTAASLETSHVETSDMVAQVVTGVPRKSLTSTRIRTQEDPDWLGRITYEWIMGMYKAYETRTMVLTGVREVEVHRYLQKKQLKIISVEIVSPPHIRLERLMELGTIKSTAHFLNQDLAERAMGLDEVCGQATYQIHTDNETSPGKLSKALLIKLSKEGYQIR